MKFALSVLALSVLTATAAPLKRAPAITDVEILNYALTLEYLEDAFYSGALARFDDAAFSDAGLDRSAFVEIAAHEAQHVSFLAGALGEKATAACTYSFPYTDVKSFASLSAVIEGVGVTAYLGAAGLISNKAYLTAAGSILTTESRHAAYVASEIGGSPWSGPEDTPLSISEVFSIAGAFIKTCPATNPAAPKTFPAITVTGDAKPDSKISLTFEHEHHEGHELYVAFFHGLDTVFAPYNEESKTVKLPKDVGTGTVYAVITTQSSGAVSDETIVAGPAILMVSEDDHEE